MSENKYIVSIDTETTGLDKFNDRIIQLAMVKYRISTQAILELSSKSWYIKPTGEYEISESSQSVHGITQDVIDAEGVSLESIIPEIEDLLKEADILTYNGVSFDIILLQRELDRIGSKLDLYSGRSFIDAFIIEKTMNSHKLAEVYKRYSGKELSDAHDALIDAKATVDVYVYQVMKYGKDAVSGIVQDTTKDVLTSPDDFVRRDDNSNLVFMKGKYRLRKVVDICEQDPSYIKFLFRGKDGKGIITDQTKHTIIEEYNRLHPKN